MQTRPPSITLYILSACSSPLALVIRRGPSKWWHFLMWNRDSGVVTPGSWFNGLIFPHRCDLSPKGDWMMILAYQGANNPPAWTALCKPPSVKAINFWPQEHAKLGGGFFDQRLPIVWMNMREQHIQPDERDKHPYDFGFLEQEDQALYGGAAERLARDGWKPVSLPSDAGILRWEKYSPKKKSLLTLQFNGTAQQLAMDACLFEEPRISYFHRLNEKDAPEQLLDGICWANYNTRGELCAARAGCLLIARQASPLHFEVVFDLTDLTPRNGRNNTPDPSILKAAE